MVTEQEVAQYYDQCEEHYRLQYDALKRGLWTYHVVLAVK